MLYIVLAYLMLYIVLAHLVLYIVLAYLMLFAALSNAVCYIRFIDVRWKLRCIYKHEKDICIA